MDFLSFLWNLQTAGSYGEALFQSVITHYDTFIHTGCKVPWALRGLSRGGMRTLRCPLLNCPKTVCTVFCCSAWIAAVLRNTTHPGGSENQIFHCNRNSPNKGNELFLSRAFHALLLRTYVPAMGFTRPAAIPPECPPVRTYTANLRKTHLYEVVQWLPRP